MLGITECCIAGFQAWAYAKSSTNHKMNNNTISISIPPKASKVLDMNLNYGMGSQDHTARTNMSIDSSIRS